MTTYYCTLESWPVDGWIFEWPKDTNDWVDKSMTWIVVWSYNVVVTFLFAFAFTRLVMARGWWTVWESHLELPTNAWTPQLKYSSLLKCWTAIYSTTKRAVKRQANCRASHIVSDHNNCDIPGHNSRAEAVDWQNPGRYVRSGGKRRDWANQQALSDNTHPHPSQAGSWWSKWSRLCWVGVVAVGI